MKKNRRFFAIAAMIWTLTAAFGMTAFADTSYVTYTGGAEKFIFEPGSEQSVTDLFTDYKNVMPGDSISDTIRVKNDSGTTVRIYLRSLGADDGELASLEDSADFLSQLGLTVNTPSGTLFDAPADQTDGLAEYVCLGTFEPGADLDLQIMLRVPADLGNEYMNCVGYLAWEFAVEEVVPGAGNGGNGSVKTGDPSDSRLLMSMAALAAAAAAIMAAVLSRKSARESRG